MNIYTYIYTYIYILATHIYIYYSNVLTKYHMQKLFFRVNKDLWTKKRFLLIFCFREFSTQL